MDPMDDPQMLQEEGPSVDYEAFLTPLPIPPTEGDVSGYNIGNGNCLVTGLKRGQTLHHSVEVRATDSEAFTCYVEVDGGDYQDAMFIAAVDPFKPVPSGTTLKDAARCNIQIHAPTIVRVCLCPISRMLILSHPAEDYKIFSVGLPETSKGSWVLAFHRNCGYIRIFDCLRTSQTHWRFPTMLRP